MASINIVDRSKVEPTPELDRNRESGASQAFHEQAQAKKIQGEKAVENLRFRRSLEDREKEQAALDSVSGALGLSAQQSVTPNPTKAIAGQLAGLDKFADNKVKLDKQLADFLQPYSNLDYGIQALAQNSSLPVQQLAELFAPYLPEGAQAEPGDLTAQVALGAQKLAHQTQQEAAQMDKLVAENAMLPSEPGGLAAGAQGDDKSIQQLGVAKKLASASGAAEAQGVMPSAPGIQNQIPMTGSSVVNAEAGKQAQVMTQLLQQNQGILQSIAHQDGTMTYPFSKWHSKHRPSASVRISSSRSSTANSSSFTVGGSSPEVTQRLNDYLVRNPDPRIEIQPDLSADRAN
jgi:hypothetical protein